MDSSLILEKLSVLESVRRFNAVLELKSLSDAELSHKIEIAGKALDRALIMLAFDLQYKIDAQRDRKNQIKISDISDNINNALEQLQNIENGALKHDLQELLVFMQLYEHNSEWRFLESKNDEVSNLRLRILSICAERFA